jgi:hypothetical protein
MALQPSTPRRAANGEARVPAPAGEGDAAAAAAPIAIACLNRAIAVSWT